MIVEALTAKLLVVVTNVGGIPKVIEDNITGLLVENGNSNQMAQKILLLKNNPEICEKFGLQGYKRVTKEYNRTTQVEKLVEEYLLSK